MAKRLVKRTPYEKMREEQEEATAKIQDGEEMPEEEIPRPDEVTIVPPATIITARRGSISSVPQSENKRLALQKKHAQDAAILRDTASRATEYEEVEV